jgi:hypothetical protein
VTKSSTESELVACSDVISIISGVKALTDELGFTIKGVRLHQDNQSTIRLIQNNKPTSQRTKHIDIRYFFLRDRNESKNLTIVNTPTQDMVADILTKPMQGHQFSRLRATITATERLVASNFKLV